MERTIYVVMEQELDDDSPAADVMYDRPRKAFTDFNLARAYVRSHGTEVPDSENHACSYTDADGWVHCFYIEEIGLI